MVFGRGKKKATTGTADNTLYLFVHPGGYRIRAPGQKGDTRRDMPATGELGQIEQLERVLGDAAGHLADRTARAVQHVAVLLDSRIVLTRDSRDRALASISDARAREVGAQLLSTSDASFGKTRFATAQSKRGAQDVFAFVDLNNLKRLLASMDQLAIQTREVVPLPYLLMRRALASGQGVYGAVHVGAEDTLVVLAHAESSTVVVRDVPIGVNAVVREVAAATEVSFAQALTGLTRRDYFQDLPASPTDTMAGVSLGAIESALSESGWALLDEVRDSLDFLTSQLGVDAPGRFELFGDAEKLPGLDRWLEDALAEHKLAQGEGELFNDFVAMPRDGVMNLLSGSAGGLFSSGNLTYEFRNNQFVAAEAGASGADTGPRALQSRAAQRRQGRRAGLLGMFSRGGGGGGSARGGVQSEGAYRAVVGVLFVIFAYLGYDMVESAGKAHAAAANAYTQARGELRGELNALKQPRVVADGLPKVEQVVDKVFWAEKFLAIGRNINPHLWLTDVYVTSGAARDGAGQRLVMIGQAQSSSDGHIHRISCFARNLTNDGPGFMDDFREVSFGGSRYLGGQDVTKGIVEFELSALYLGTAQRRPPLTPEERTQLEQKLEECRLDSEKVKMGSAAVSSASG